MALALALAMVLGLAATSARADDGRYLAAIKQARSICLGAGPDDKTAAAAAVSALRQGTGDSQLEAIHDLDQSPPRFDLAAQRLLSIEQTIETPFPSTDRAKADSQLRSILSQARFQANGPSLLDRIQAWLLNALGGLLRLAFGGAGGIGRLVEFAIAIAVGVAVAAFLARSLWSRRGGSAATVIAGARPRQVVDWFAEADRLASAGDFPAALRALTSGVATAIGGEGAWETSPLTVRELFLRSARVDPLRPLLIPFEASAYGHREPDAAVYARAAEVAAPYRAAEAS